MVHRRGETNAWVSMVLMAVLGILIAVFIYRRPQKPLELPGGQSAATTLPSTIDVSSTDSRHYLAALSAYNWYVAARIRPDELISHPSWMKLTAEVRDDFQRRIGQALGGIPLQQIQEWTGLLAPGYALWVAELKTPIGGDSLPSSWKRSEKTAYGVPIYHAEGPQPIAGYFIVPNGKLVVAATRVDTLDTLIAASRNPPLPMRAGLFGTAPFDVVVSDLRWLRSPLQGVSLGPPPKNLPAAGRLAATKLEDWVKDLAGGKASADWKGDVLQVGVVVSARDPKSAKIIAERLETTRKQLSKGGGEAGAFPSFSATGEEIKYEAAHAPSDLIEAASRLPLVREAK